MTTNKKQPKERQLRFEEAFTQLRETVEALERGGLPLEEATALFEQCMRLAKTCNELLAAAELRISRLQRSFGEQMAMVDNSLRPEPDEPGPEPPSEDD